MKHPIKLYVNVSLVLFHCFFGSYFQVRYYTHQMTLAPYLAKINQEISLLFNRTDFVNKAGSAILRNKGVESEERGEVSPLALNFPKCSWRLCHDFSLFWIQTVPNLLLSRQKPGQYNQFQSYVQRQLSKISSVVPHYWALVKFCALFCQSPLSRQNSSYAPDEKGKFFLLFSFRRYHSFQICMNIKPFLFRFQCYVLCPAFIATCAHVKQKRYSNTRKCFPIKYIICCECHHLHR